MLHSIQFISQLDHKVFDYFEKSRSSKMTRFLRLITVNPIVLYVFLLLIDATYYNNKYILAFPLLIFTDIIVVFIKQYIKRARPLPRKGKFLHELLDLQPDNYSFPSAHSFSMFQLVTLSFALLSYSGIVILLYSFFIAFTRIYLSYHYLSDVIVGSLLGTISGALILNLVLNLI